MGRRYSELSARHVEFIARQRILLVGTPPAVHLDDHADGRDAPGSHWARSTFHDRA